MIKFTAIMPVYNAETKIKKSIESIINQTYSNWELIIVDDGSTDNSYEKCKAYAKKDKRIKVYTKKNEGPGKARNYGIGKCTGDYICFIDSDDYFESNYFEVLEGNIKANDYDLVYFNVIMENEDGKINRINNTKRFDNLEKDQIIKSQMMGILSWAAWLKVAKSSIIKKCKFSNLSVGEEAIFSFYVLYNSNKIGFIDKNLYHYVYNENGQHKKGGIDPWKKVAIEFKKEIQNKEELQKYNKAVNGLAFRGLTIAIKRICCDNNYRTARKTIKQYIKEYKDEFEIYNVEKELLDKTSKLIMALIKLRLYFVIYVATKIKYKKEI